MPEWAVDYMLTMIIGFIVATFLSIIGAVGIGMLVMGIWGDVEGVITGFICAIVIFIIISLMTHEAAMGKRMEQ